MRQAITLALALPWLLAGTLLLTAAEPSAFELRAVAETSCTTTREFVLSKSVDASEEKIQVENAVLLDASSLRRAYTAFGNHGALWVGLQFTEEGTKRFTEITTEYSHRRLAFFLDGKLVMAPRIVCPIYGDTVTISGKFEAGEIQRIVERLKAVTVPSPTP